MTTEIPPQTKLISIEKKKVFYVRRDFGKIISWWKKERVDTIGQDLYIQTQDKFENIYLNGKKINI